MLDNNDDDFTRGADRELTLSTGSLLGIFLGLVLLCGAFFGFGYKMGSHKAAPLPALADATSADSAAAPPSTDFSGFKPAAGSPAASANAGSINAGSPASAPRSSTVTSSAAGRDSTAVREGTGAGDEAAAVPATRSTAVTPALRSAPAPIVRAAPPPSAESLAASLAAPPAAGGASFVVQVAAVSLQEDADLLAGALRSKGYAVSERAQADKLIHIQVGPFRNHQDAEAMRQRLLADGYNALVK